MRTATPSISLLITILILWHSHGPRQGASKITALALAPPHPNWLVNGSVPFHSTDEFRRLFQQPSNLNNNSRSNSHKPRPLHPALCRNLSSESECDDLNESYRQHTRNMQTILQTVGRVHPLVILVHFPDHADRPLPSRDKIVELFHGEGRTDDTPTGSVGAFVQQNSYHQFQWDTGILDWTFTDQTEEVYSYGVSGLTADLAYALHPILNKHFFDGHDFSKYDLDQDGIIDTAIVLHSGVAAEIGGVDCYNNNDDHNFRIWSHAIGKTSASWRAPDGSISMGGYMVASAVKGSCGGKLQSLGVLTHEFLHTIGLPDLYDGNWIGKGLGVYDIMSNPYGVDASQEYPAHLSPWCKMEMGWVQPVEITQDGLYSIEASALSPQVYKISHGFPKGEYLLIENRQPLLWDEQLFDGGLLIYHIDDSLGGTYNMIRGWPGQEGWPSNGLHYRVALVQADDIYDLELGENIGHANDFFVAGRELGPAPIEYGPYATLEYYPNTNSYQDGNLKQTGIRIHDISPSDTVMTFRVSGISSVLSQGGVSAQIPTRPPSPQPTLNPPPSPFPTWPPKTNPPSPSPTWPPPPTQPPVDPPPPTPFPTNAPSTSLPTNAPTVPPPTLTPTRLPTPHPTPMPTRQPSPTPTRQPTPRPTPSPATTTDSIPTTVTLPPIPAVWQTTGAEPSWSTWASPTADPTVLVTPKNVNGFNDVQGSVGGGDDDHNQSAATSADTTTTRLFLLPLLSVVATMMTWML